MKMLLLVLVLLGSVPSFAKNTLDNLSSSFFSPSKVEFLEDVSFKKFNRELTLNSGCEIDYIKNWSDNSVTFEKGDKYRATYISIDDDSLYITFESVLNDPYEFILLCYNDDSGIETNDLSIGDFNKKYLDGKMKIIP